MTTSRLTPIGEFGIAVMFGLIAGAVFYREILASGFDLVFGDSGDARLAMMLMEHWRLVFEGKEAIVSPRFFFPVTGTLGYTDANFLYGVVFSLGRWAGLDVYSAFQLVVMSWGAIGYGAMFWLLRRLLGVNLLISLVWSSLFAFSNLNAIQVGHMQLLTLAMIPLIIGWAILVARALAAETPRRAVAPGLAIAVLFPLMMFTGFYVCWYLVLFTLTFVLVATIMALASGRRSQVAEVLRIARRNWVLLALLALVAAIFTVPFALTYGPQIVGGNGFTPDDLFRATFPRPKDLINVGTENLVWGWLITLMIPDVYTRLGGYELLMGFPLGIFALFLFATVVSLRADVFRRNLLLAALTVSVLIGLVLIVNVEGSSLWWAVRRIVPGASAIRVVSRYQVLLYFFVLLASALVLSEEMKRLRRLAAPARLAIVGLGALFLLAEQIQPTFAHVRKGEEFARLNRIPPVPAGCTAFGVAPPRREDHAGMDWDGRMTIVRRMLVDAVYIAARDGVPTINGLSSLNPPEYRFVDLTDPNYPAEAGMWVARYGLENGFCLLDIDHADWRRVVPDPAPLPTGVDLMRIPELYTFEGAMRLANYGFAGGPPDMWTGADAGFRFKTPVRDVVPKLSIFVTNLIGSDVTFLVNGREVSKAHYDTGAHQLVGPPTAALGSIGVISSTFRPYDLTRSPDRRRLGVLIHEVVLDKAPPQ